VHQAEQRAERRLRAAPLATTTRVRVQICSTDGALFVDRTWHWGEWIRSTSSMTPPPRWRR
jgi:hypothetical protein